jgi:hypothetical protein
MNPKLLQAMAVLLACWGAHAQVNSGSNGSDGAFNPSTNTVINMADHPDGIYHYTSVNIPSGVTVTFIPNANNTPVVWLVQSNVVISGLVDVSGQNAPQIGDVRYGQGGQGGPGGFRGGNGGITASAGYGPGGGAADYNGQGGTFVGNQFLVPLIGGSGGGGSTNGGGGGGGGGALLIAASGTIQFNGGGLSARGGNGAANWSQGSWNAGGGGSGGAIRLVAARITGWGSIDVRGGGSAVSSGYGSSGRVRFDAFENEFSGNIDGAYSQGAQFVILPSAGQFPQLTIASVGGVPVSASPSGALSTPDAVLSAQQNNPIPIVVHCSNIPLDTQITVHVRPARGAAVSATGRNNSGTLASSTATILINIPRGGGWIYATAATGN